MEFAVQDMSCGECAHAISRAIAGPDPAAEAEIDVSSKIVKITPTVPATQLLAAIAAAGFHPSVRD